MAYDDPVDVAAENGVVPDARIISERDVAEHDGAGGDVNAVAEFWLAAQKAIELSFQFAHARFIADSNGNSIKNPPTCAGGALRSTHLPHQ